MPPNPISNSRKIHLTFVLQSWGFTKEGAAALVAGEMPINASDRMRLSHLAQQQSASNRTDIESKYKARESAANSDYQILISIIRDMNSQEGLVWKHML